MQINVSTVNNTQINQQANINNSLPYKVGDRIEGEVIAAEGNNVSMRLSNGTVMEAQLQTDVSISKGDTLTLVVTNKSMGSDIRTNVMTLRLSSVNGKQPMQENSSIQELLLNAKMEASTQQIKLTQLMQELKLPITSQAIEKAQEAVTKFPGLAPKTAVFMASQNIPFNEKNVNTVNRWVQHNPTAVKALEQVTQLMVQSIEINEQDALKDAVNSKFFKDVQSLMGGKDAPLNKAQIITKAFEGFMEGLPDKAQKMIEGKQGLKEGLIKLMVSYDADKGVALREIFKNLDGFTKNQQLYIAKNFSQSLKSLGEELKALDQKPNMIPEKQLLGEEIAKVFARIKPDNPQNAEEMKKAAKSFTELLSKLSEGGSDEKQTTSAKVFTPYAEQLLNQAKLGSDCTNFLYLQVPFNVKKEESAQLFVMKRKGSEKIDPSNTTVVVSVQTQRLGQVDSIIKIEQNNMDLQVRVESPNQRDALKKQTPRLRELLKDTQYSLRNVQFNLASEKVSPVNVLSVVDEKTSQLGLNITV